MKGEALQEDGWILREAIAADVDELMRWFPKFDDVHVWGGPSFRFPFTRETFFKDIYWGKMASLCLCDPANRVVAFGQLYERDGRIHLARLVVIPDMRGHGVGRRLIEIRRCSQVMNTRCSSFATTSQPLNVTSRWGLELQTIPTTCRTLTCATT